MEDSFRFVLTQCNKVDLLKTKLWIVFDGETGLDYGGVARFGNNFIVTPSLKTKSVRLISS